LVATSNHPTFNHATVM